MQIQVNVGIKNNKLSPKVCKPENLEKLEKNLWDYLDQKKLGEDLLKQLIEQSPGFNTDDFSKNEVKKYFQPQADEIKAKILPKLYSSLLSKVYSNCYVGKDGGLKEMIKKDIYNEVERNFNWSQKRDERKAGTTTKIQNLENESTAKTIALSTTVPAAGGLGAAGVAFGPKLWALAKTLFKF